MNCGDKNVSDVSDCGHVLVTMALAPNLFDGGLKEDTEEEICDRYFLRWKINFYGERFVFVRVGVAESRSSGGHIQTPSQHHCFII